MSAPSWAEMRRVFGRIGVLSFGGPAAQIALMHKELVEDRNWLSEQMYLRALSLCMFLPGPEAMQLATYAGWRLRGVAGGLLAGLMFVIPGAIVIAALALTYVQYGQLDLVQAGFLGVKAAVIAVVVQALIRVARNALIGALGWSLAIGSFIGLFVFGLPFPLIILLAAACGMLFWQREATGQLPAPETKSTPLKTIAIWGALWLCPLLVLYLLEADFLFQLGLFFAKLAVVTFGGAYAVLAYMTQTVVQDFGWISTAEMMDALGLAETTPGPLILVTEFVALLAGYLQSGIAGAIAAGVLTLWVTFTPCFLWIFLAGPYLDRISANPKLAAALQGITAAVVGVIANLSIWFALHVLFTSHPGQSQGWPDPNSFSPVAAGLTCAAFVLMFAAKYGFVHTMIVLVALALGLEWVL